MSKVTVNTNDVKHPIAPDLYGLFFEDINRSGDSGLYPELLRNRSFEDSIPPERCTLSEDGVSFTTPLGWSDQFNNGEGLKRWMEGVPPTPIPAWYANDAQISLDYDDTLNAKRLVSLKVIFSAKGSISNIGYQGIPLRKGDEYVFYMFAKASDSPSVLSVAIASSGGKIQQAKEFTIECGEYKRYECMLTAVEYDFDARLIISTDKPAQINIGFTSLMPADTYKGHGMRKDLMQMLEKSNSKFLRFPGGCIVEGFTYETAMRFSNTIGPVWERPSHVLMWHYRTTNGLGFHEYLQICEDLDIEPMYVINCGLTCQARSAELFVDKELEDMLNEAFDAIEYATGDASTPMGKKRAEAGHPEPFKLKYIEIGNENWGEEYNWRYKMFYDALKKRYPNIKYISNTHSELDGLPTEIADEHYYNTPEFFAENIHKYDSYDRNGPEIFVGEYAVTTGAKTATLRCALSEAMFLLGVENNQDIVTLTAYAPLFQNIGYTAWYPNLIVFDNHRTCGIPTYHALSMLGGNRGKTVVTSNVETKKLYRDVHGMPGVISARGGMSFRNALLNGKSVSISHEIQGNFTDNGGEYTSVSNPLERERVYRRPGMEAMGDVVWATVGEETGKEYTFQVDMKSQADNPVTIAVWCHRPYSVFRIDETAEEKWDMRSVRAFTWTVDGTSSSVWDGIFFRRAMLGEKTPAEVNIEQYNTYKIITREDGFDCYINDTLVHKAYIPDHTSLAVTASTEDDSVIVKLINLKGETDHVEINLDSNVQSNYSAIVLTGDGPDATNTLDSPLAVSPTTKELTGASRTFTYDAPAYSLNILKLKK